MVMAGVLINERDIVKLEEIGVKDSKLLTKEKREELFGKIKEIAVDFKIEVLDPEVIDDALNSESLNLNWLEANTQVEIVNGLGPDKVIVDCPSVNVSAYTDYFKKRLGREIDLVMEHKADLKYVVVGAASILAKVVRDEEIEKIKKKFGVEFGSGYLSDERTQVFLKESFDDSRFAGVFRKSWQPFQKLVKERGQKSLGDY